MSIVLEGVLAKIPPYPEVGSGVSKFFRKTTVPVAPSPDSWGWSIPALRLVNDKSYRMNIPIDVITFISQDVADKAATWMAQYSIRVASCEFFDFDWFCKSILWRPDIDVIVDSSNARLDHYGAKGFQAVWGGDF